MCGIAGFVSDTEFAGDRMVEVLSHRGPDAHGGFKGEMSGKSLFLGHARLSIIDLSAAGNQPMYSDDKQVVLVFNGEIYNYQLLRDRYLRDVAMSSRTDTEVVLRLYEKLGLRCLEQLNGDFAIALLDRRAGKLFLIRDRVGVKPLYYCVPHGGILFGSEIKALLAAGWPAQLDVSELQRFFVFKYTPGAKTLFKGVERVPPGHYLEFDIARATSSLHRYWEPRYDEVTRIDYREAQVELRRLLEDATRMRLVADVPVGTFLSGGIDSTIVAGILRDQKQLTHYCARQSDDAVREEGTVSDYRFARRVADQWELRLEVVDVGAGTVTQDQIRTTAVYGDDLIADSAQVPCYLITQGAAETSKVFLSGMGADEILLGYAGHQLALLWTYLERIPLARTLVGLLGGIDQGRGSFKAFRRHVYRLGRYAEYPNIRYGIFSIVGDFESSARVVTGDRAQLNDYLGEYFPDGKDPFDCFKRFEFDNFLQKNLSYVDRMSMANSVEVRVPYLDHRVVDFAFSLPRNYKLGPLGRSKKVLVDAFADLLPRYVVNRRKAGFAMPIRSVLGQKSKVEELLNLEALSSIGAFDRQHILSLIERHIEGREDNSSIIYALISFQQWHSIYFQ